jgi:aryl-phospho-beta-D-glucosidase BglC (GH1 family)
MLKKDTEYDEQVFEKVKKKQEVIRVKKVINEARKLGLEVTLPQPK